MSAMLTSLRRFAGRVRRSLHGERPAEAADPTFDVYDLPAVNAILARHGVEPLCADPAQAEAGPGGATRFVLARLAASAELRAQFPRALGDGPEGDFARRLMGTCGDAARQNVCAAFASYPGERVRRIYEYRPDMRTALPFGLTPQQRAAYLDWLLAYGGPEMGVSPEQALWFLFQLEETPDRGLVAQYLLNADWQARVPHGLTVFGWRELLAFLRRERGLRGRWQEALPPPRVYRPWDELTLLRHARPELNDTFPPAGDADAVLAWIDQRPDLVEPDAAWRAELTEDVRNGLSTRPGVNILGHFRYPSGLQQAAATLARTFAAMGWRTALRDLPIEFPSDLSDRARYDGVELFDTTIYCASISPPADALLQRCGMAVRPGVRRVAVWYWESDVVPEAVPARPAPFDEVWAPTRFVAEAFRRRVTVPVVPMLPGVEPPRFAPQPRAEFGLRDDRFLFLFTFDMASLMARKNPLAVVEAFRRAFRPEEPVELVIKVARGGESPADLAALAAACTADNVTLVNELWPRERLLALMACCDCYVSLHRSEGLGLGMAEAMLMGKPVVATNYSGNLDFLTPETGYLVEGARVPVPASVSQYPPGSHWVEPSAGHAARLMRHVFEHRDEAKATGGRARAAVAELMSLRAAGQRMAARLGASSENRPGSVTCPVSPTG